MNMFFRSEPLSGVLHALLAIPFGLAALWVFAFAMTVMA